MGIGIFICGEKGCVKRLERGRVERVGDVGRG